MPAQTLEQVKRNQAALEKSVAELGESAEPAKRRATQKQLRRAQRKRRRLTVVAERHAPKAEAKAEEPAAE